MNKALTILSGLLIVLLTACGSKGSSSDTGAAVNASKELVIHAKKNFEFDQKEYHIKKGEAVKISLDNTQGAHGASIGGLNVQLDGNKKKSQVVVPDKEGSYDIICSIPCGSGHAAMKSKIVVEA